MPALVAFLVTSAPLLSQERRGDGGGFDGLGDGLSDLLISDAVLVDVDLGEDGLEEQPLALVVGMTVDPIAVAHELEDRFEEFGAGIQVGDGFVQSARQLGSSDLDVVESLADLLASGSVLGCQIEKVLLLDIEPSQFGAELLAVQVRGRLAVSQGFLHLEP